jgi:uncharacterized protein
MQFPDARILVFAKAPRSGAVKTRLVPALGADGAAALHAALVRHTLDSATAHALCPVELWCAPDTDDPFFAECEGRWLVTLRAQQGEGLGARMQHALSDALDRARRALLIGSDCPALTPQLLAQALAGLDDVGIDAVFTPAQDGGYVLIGLRSMDAGLFEDIPWGSSRVMELTRERMRQTGWRWIETETLRDIDDPDDLVDLDRYPDLRRQVPPAG